MPSSERLWRHIRLCASEDPWFPDCERTGDLDGARESYARSALLAPKYVKARVNGERTAMLRSSTDGGVESGHMPEAGDGEE